MKPLTDLPDQTTQSPSDLNIPHQEAAEFDLPSGRNRIKFGLWLASIGFLVFLLGTRPSLFGLDRSPVVGFVQISVFLIGLALLALGSALTLASFWPEGKQTIAAQIGSRLISTGYVICLFTGLADVLGFGSHPLPDVFFGVLQQRGMGLGMMTMAVGFLLMIPYKRIDRQPTHKTNQNEEQNLNNQGQKKSQTDCFNFSNLKLFR